MEYLIMNRKELEQSKAFEQIKTNQMTRKAVSIRLGVSQRWVRKKFKRYVKDGDKGLLHKSRGKPSNRKWSSDYEMLLVGLLSKEWRDFGPTFAAEKLEELYQIKASKETVRKVMIKNNQWKPKVGKFKHRERRDRKEMLGIMIQLDGSPHDWFEGRAGECTLLVFIDDATSQILWLEFAPSESMQSLMKATKNYVKKFGVPHIFYTDHGSVFHVNVNNKEEERKTHWELAVEQLGIETIHAHSPQAKGRVERCNQTMQDRLVKELRLQNISSIESANEYLKSSNFIMKHNQKFAIKAQQAGDAHRSSESFSLENIFTVKEIRILTNDFTLHYNRQFLQLHKKQTVAIQPKNKITVQTDLEQNITLWIKGKQLSFNEMKDRSELKVEEKIIVDKVYKPSKNSQRWVGGMYPTYHQSRVKSAMTAVESTY